MSTHTQFVQAVRPWGNAERKSSAVLVVGGFDSDLIALLHILGDTDWTLYWNTTWSDAVETLRCRPISVVLCDRDLPDGGWKDLLELTSAMSSPPPVIVTARFANERLWAEVLSLNGYDVLTKPFDADEVIRTVGLALECWTSGGASAA